LGTIAISKQLLYLDKRSFFTGVFDDFCKSKRCEILRSFIRSPSYATAWIKTGHEGPTKWERGMKTSGNEPETSTAPLGRGMTEFLEYVFSGDVSARQ
jgi:hypothetical protein